MSERDFEHEAKDLVNQKLGTSATWPTIADRIAVGETESRLRAEAQITELEQRLENSEERLHRISDWCEAYPLEAFPLPNLDRCRTLLGDPEFTRLNAHSMRHVVNGIAAIAKPAEPQPQHSYLSTACFHEQHESCRKSCKFCRVECRCTCHRKPAQSPKEKV